MSYDSRFPYRIVGGNEEADEVIHLDKKYRKSNGNINNYKTKIIIYIIIPISRLNKQIKINIYNLSLNDIANDAVRIYAIVSNKIQELEVYQEKVTTEI